MQWTDPFCKCISKWLLNGKAPHHESDTFTRMLRDYSINMCQMLERQFLALVIPKSWRFTILVEAHDKLGHQGNNSHILPNKKTILLERYEQGHKKIHCKLTALSVNVTKQKFNNIPPADDEDTRQTIWQDCHRSGIPTAKLPASGNKHILTIIDHPTGWPRSFSHPRHKSADTIVAMLINNYLPVHMCPRYILPDNGTEFKNNLMDLVLQQLGIDRIFSVPYHPQSNRKLKVFHKYLKPTLKKLCEKDPANWDKYINQVLASYRITPNIATAESPFFLVYGRDHNLPLHQLLEPMQHFLGDPDSGKITLRDTQTGTSNCKENTGWE